MTQPNTLYPQPISSFPQPTYQSLPVPLHFPRRPQLFRRPQPTKPDLGPHQPRPEPARGAHLGPGAVRPEHGSAGVRRRHALASVTSTASYAPIKQRRLEPPTRAAFLAAQHRRRPRTPRAAACVRPEPVAARFAVSTVHRAKPRLPWGSRGSVAPPQPLPVTGPTSEHRRPLRTKLAAMNAATGHLSALLCPR
jgi:hypothetical protein